MASIEFCAGVTEPTSVSDAWAADQTAAIVSPPVAKGIRGEQAGEVPAVLASLHDEPVAICALDGLKLKPTRVFNLT